MSLFSSVSYLDIYLSLYPFVSCPNWSTTCSSYNTRNVVRYIKIGVKLSFLCSNPNIAGGKRKFADVRVVGWRVAFLHCEGQVVDRERDIREVSSGPTQLQPIRNVLQPLTIGSRSLPSMLVLCVHARRVLHSLQG